MSTYKITNITNHAGKRDFKFNSVLDVEYVDDMVKKVVKIKPGDSIYLTTGSLPLSVHRLRVKGLITVVEIGAVELAKAMEDLKPKTAKKKIDVKIEKKDAHEHKEQIYSKKKTSKKSIEDEVNDSKQEE